jgi:hypothetical protein
LDNRDETTLVCVCVVVAVVVGGGVTPTVSIPSGIPIQFSQANFVHSASTIRHLHDRIKEHMTQSTLSVFSHLRACQQDNIDIFNVTVEIIITENDTVNL